MEVHTVLGAVPISSLGATLVHEHLWTRHETVYAQFPDLYDPERALRQVVDVLCDAKGKGLGTLCDATVMGLGRDIHFMRQASALAGVNIVAATGIYTFDSLPPYFASRGVEAMAEAFIRDLTFGIQGTSSRAGFLKCATDVPGLTPGVEKVLRAVARAHTETNAPIMTHTSAAHRSGLDQIRIFSEEGVDLSSVVIGHCGDTDDLDYLMRLLDEGVALGMDRYGEDDRLNFDRRQNAILELCRRGYAGQLVLSQDHSIVRDICYDDATLAQRRNWRTAFIFERVLDDLAARGLDASIIEAMTRANAHRWLGRQRSNTTQ